MLLQAPIPGGPELVIILVVMLVLFGPVVAVVVLFLQRTQDDDEVAELKARVDELEAEIAAGDETASNDVSVEDQRADEGGNRERDDGDGR